MNLLTLSFIISILGILTLLILSSTLEPKLTNINEINSKYLNKKVKIQGTINSIKNYDEFQLLTLKDSIGEIEVLVEKSPIKLQKSQTLIVTGRVNQYKDILQIIANEIQIR